MFRAYTLPDVLTRYVLPLNVESNYGTFVAVDRATSLDGGRRVELHNVDGLHIIDGETFVRVVNAVSLDAVEPAGIICHDGTAVDLSLGVPACLQAKPIPGSRFNDWVTAHNRALDDYSNNRARRNETAVLSLLDGILSYCRSHDSMGTGDDVDWYGAEHVLVPLLDGFDNALNFDLGRLDGGTLSGVSHAIRNAYAGGLGA